MKAYLNLILDASREGTFPPVIGVAIHSSPPEGLTNIGRLVYANMLSCDGKDYGEARENMLKYLHEMRGWEWILPWLEDGMEAHAQRYEMQAKLQEELNAKFPIRPEYKRIKLHEK
jgi:hypothetical protein